MSVLVVNYVGWSGEFQTAEWWDALEMQNGLHQGSPDVPVVVAQGRNAVQSLVDIHCTGTWLRDLSLRCLSAVEGCRVRGARSRYAVYVKVRGCGPITCRAKACVFALFYMVQRTQ